MLLWARDVAFRLQSTRFPERLDDYIADHIPARVIDVFDDALDLERLGFDGIQVLLDARAAFQRAAV